MTTESSLAVSESWCGRAPKNTLQILWHTETRSARSFQELAAPGTPARSEATVGTLPAAGFTSQCGVMGVNVGESIRTTES
jgi:hypothetical protein